MYLVKLYTTCQRHINIKIIDLKPAIGCCITQQFPLMHHVKSYLLKTFCGFKLLMRVTTHLSGRRSSEKPASNISQDSCRPLQYPFVPKYILARKFKLRMNPIFTPMRHCSLNPSGRVLEVHYIDLLLSFLYKRAQNTDIILLSMD